MSFRPGRDVQHSDEVSPGRSPQDSDELSPGSGAQNSDEVSPRQGRWRVATGGAQFAARRTKFNEWKAKAPYIAALRGARCKRCIDWRSSSARYHLLELEQTDPDLPKLTALLPDLLNRTSTCTGTAGPASSCTE